MDGKFKKPITLSIMIVVTGFLIYWAGFTSPKKEVIKKEMVQDVLTQEVLPYYSIFYKWDGKQQMNAWWIIFKKYNEWKVVEFKDINRSTSAEDLLKFAVKFDYKWIDNYAFSAQPSRYQTILIISGFQPTFADEKHVFLKILNEIKEQK